MRTICASIVSLPTRSTCISSDPEPLTEPPISRAVTFLATGIDSPVSIDSSTLLTPSSTDPSAGIF